MNQNKSQRVNRAAAAKPALKAFTPWVPSPGLLSRVNALALNIAKLPVRSRDFARKSLGDAITYGLREFRVTGS